MFRWPNPFGNTTGPEVGTVSNKNEYHDSSLRDSKPVQGHIYVYLVIIILKPNKEYYDTYKWLVTHIWYRDTASITL